MDKIITVLGYKKNITEMNDAPDCCSDIFNFKTQHQNKNQKTTTLARRQPSLNSSKG